MEKKEEAAAKFIGALIKSLQTLCHGYLDFQTGIEIIGHINLSVDKGSSLDYVLKEKVCRNAENSTLFISNSFHAEAKGEEISLRKSDGSQCTISMDQSEGGKVASAISSISSSLSGSQHKQQRGSEARDYCASHIQHKGSSKRRSVQDQSGDLHAAKVSHMSSESSHSQCASSPTRSRVSLHGVETSDTAASETMLPQTASVGDSSGIGVNLAGSVLEPVVSQNDSDLHQRDDDSDGDLEVTFIKEEYGHGEGGGDFDNSGAHQFAGASAQREGSRFAGLADSGAAFLSASFDHGQQFSPDAGPSSSQPGSCGLRGSPSKVDWHPDKVLDSEKSLLPFPQAFPAPFLPQAPSISCDVSSKAFRCHMCSYSVDRSDSLKRHMRLHTGNMFRCQHCGLQYNSRHNLVTHQRKKHSYEALPGTSSPP